LEKISLVFDTGCIVLIWLVQLIIYPSFGFYKNSNLKKWHSKYTGQVSLVVVPLMFGQLITSGWQTLQIPSALNVIKLVMILAVWAITFLVFVPLHRNIDQQENSETYLDTLVHKNWTRTVLWSAVFLLSLVQNIIF
jgi:hypothetical protein